MTDVLQVERIALALWKEPGDWRLTGEVGSPERWEACKREALGILEAHRHWKQTGEN